MTKYIDMPPRELHNKLMHNYPNPIERELKKTAILQAKEAQRIERITRKMHKRQWGDLINPLKYELTNARVGVKHNGKHQEERRLAFEAYIRLLEKLLSKFDTMQLLKDEDGKPFTPSQLAQESDIPNKGVHWTDWIPQSKKVEVSVLFDDIPSAPKTKRKIPFQRTQRPNTRQRDALLKRTLNELAVAQTEYRIKPTEKLESTIRHMEYAIKRIEQLLPTDVVPRTWHGVE